MDNRCIARMVKKMRTAKNQFSHRTTIDAVLEALRNQLMSKIEPHSRNPLNGAWIKFRKDSKDVSFRGFYKATRRTEMPVHRIPDDYIPGSRVTVQNRKLDNVIDDINYNRSGKEHLYGDDAGTISNLISTIMDNFNYMLWSYVRMTENEKFDLANIYRYELIRHYRKSAKALRRIVNS